MKKAERYVVLDTETTGMNRKRNGGSVCVGHRIIEIGCVDMGTKRRFHVYINPEQDVQPGASRIHGVTSEFLKDKPLFRDVASKFIKFIKGATVIIHNAPFDIAFINQELGLLPRNQQPNETFRFIDSLELARDIFPGVRNDLDSLCDRMGVEGRHGCHGALLDAELLSEVYTRMTKGRI